MAVTEAADDQGSVGDPVVDHHVEAAKPDNLTDRNWTVKRPNRRSFWKSGLFMENSALDMFCNIVEKFAKFAKSCFFEKIKYVQTFSKI